jgi:hypothetical protein
MGRAGTSPTAGTLNAIFLNIFGRNGDGGIRAAINKITKFYEK